MVENFLTMAWPERYFDQVRTSLTMVGHGVNILFRSLGSLFIKVRGAQILK
jgi:hypothetical protein